MKKSFADHIDSGSELKLVDLELDSEFNNIE